MRQNTKNTNAEEVLEPVVEETPVKEAAPVEVPKKKVKTGKVVNCDALRVRYTALTSAAVITTIPKDTEVVINGVDGDFYKVKVGDVEGYCMKQFIK